MAISAPTIRRVTVYGNRRIVFADYTFSGTVAAGGEAITLAPLGLTTIDNVTINNAGNVAFAHNFDIANNKITVWQGTAAYTGAATHTIRVTYHGQ